MSNDQISKFRPTNSTIRLLGTDLVYHMHKITTNEIGKAIEARKAFEAREAPVELAYYGDMFLRPGETITIVGACDEWFNGDFTVGCSQLEISGHMLSPSEYIDFKFPHIETPKKTKQKGNKFKPSAFDRLSQSKAAKGI